VDEQATLKKAQTLSAKNSFLAKLSNKVVALFAAPQPFAAAA